MNYFKYILTFLFSSIIFANFSIHFDYMSGYAKSILSSNQTFGDNYSFTIEAWYKNYSTNSGANEGYDDGSNIYIYYASRFIVRNAEVVVSNGAKDYIFDYTNFIYDVDMDKALQEVYIYNGNDLNPQPGETWTLHVSAPGGFEATGQTIIPPTPKLFTENLPDTFQVFREMEMSWLTMNDNYQLINSAHLGPWDSYLCGINQEHIISPEESLTVAYFPSLAIN